MIKFRFITSEEEDLIRQNIDSKFGEGIFDKIKNDSQLIVAIGNWKEIFLISPKLGEIFEKLRGIINPYFLGLYIGDISKNQFKIQINGFVLISQYTNRFVVVTNKGEQTALYGRNIPISLIIKIEMQAKKGDFVIIKNQLNESLALGKFLIDSDKISKINNPNKVIIKIISDLGWYIRKGK